MITQTRPSEKSLKRMRNYGRVKDPTPDKGREARHKGQSMERTVSPPFTTK